MKKFLLIAAAALCFHSVAKARMHGMAHPTCLFDSPFDDGGCDALLNSGRPGLYTVSGVNGSPYFNYARQSGQTPYPVRPAYNLPGEDYAVGPWATPTGNPITASWSTVIPAAAGTCSYVSASFWVRCNLVSNTLVATISSGGVLNYVSGTTPVVGQYVYSGVYGSTYAPYLITTSLGGGQWQLASAPDLYTGSYVGGVFVQQTTAPVVGSQTFYMSAKMMINGFNFDDTRMYFTGTGYLDIENNSFAEGANTCANGSGSEILNVSHATNTPVRLYSNFGTMDPTCSNAANLYPNAGGGTAQATFGGTISNGTTLTITSGTNPIIGQYIAGPGFSSTPSQVGANPSTGVYSLSVPEPNGTYVTMTTGPILGRNGTILAAPGGSGMVDAEYNYSDKIGYLLTANMGGSIAMKHNFIDIVGGPTGHTSPFLQEAQFLPAISGVSFTASGSGTTLTIASGTAPTVGWLVSTANNAVDGSFTTATVTAISGSTVTLSVSEPTQSNVTFYSGPLYTVPYIIQSENVIINNGSSSAGQIYGASTFLTGNTQSGTGYWLFAQGSGTSEGSFFTTSGYGNEHPTTAPSAYYVQYNYNEYVNNVVVANSSSNNYTNTRVVNTSNVVRFLAQGSGWGSYVGAFPGSVAAANITGNYIDPKGASSCTRVDVGVYTSPANGIPLVPIYSGNVDLIDGSTIDATHCAGVNNP